MFFSLSISRYEREFEKERERKAMILPPLPSSSLVVLLIPLD
jgi:hypothetical protein